VTGVISAVEISTELRDYALNILGDSRYSSEVRDEATQVVSGAIVRKPLLKNDLRRLEELLKADSELKDGHKRKQAKAAHANLIRMRDNSEKEHEVSDIRTIVYACGKCYYTETYLDQSAFPNELHSHEGWARVSAPNAGPFR
jgi:hypothetical protein